MRILPTWLCVCPILASITAQIFCPPLAIAQAPAIAPEELEFFEKQVRPLLIEHCYECHAAGEKNGGLLLDSRDAVLRGGDTGPALVPGQPDKSLLIEAIGYKNHDLQMPPSKPLNPGQVAILVDWVKRGAPDPRESASASNRCPGKRHVVSRRSKLLVIATNQQSRDSVGEAD